MGKQNMQAKEVYCKHSWPAFTANQLVQLVREGTFLIGGGGGVGRGFRGEGQ